MEWLWIHDRPEIFTGRMAKELGRIDTDSSSVETLRPLAESESFRGDWTHVCWTTDTSASCRQSYMTLRVDSNSTGTCVLRFDGFDDVRDRVNWLTSRRQHKRIADTSRT